MEEELAKTLAERNAKYVGWLKSKRVIIHSASKETAERAQKYLREALSRMGLDVNAFSFEIRVVNKDDVLGGDALIHAWLGKKKMNEPALHVYVGKLVGTDTFGNAIYHKLASGVPLMGTLVIHENIMRERGELKERTINLIIHELGHVLAGLKHDDASLLRIMHPLRPVFDEKSKKFFRTYLEELEKLHQTKYVKKKKPWWKFW